MKRYPQDSLIIWSNESLRSNVEHGKEKDQK